MYELREKYIIYFGACIKKILSSNFEIDIKTRINNLFKNECKDEYKLIMILYMRELSFRRNYDLLIPLINHGIMFDIIILYNIIIDNQKEMIELFKFYNIHNPLEILHKLVYNLELTELDNSPFNLLKSIDKKNFVSLFHRILNSNITDREHKILSLFIQAFNTKYFQVYSNIINDFSKFNKYNIDIDKFDSFMKSHGGYNNFVKNN